MIRKQNSRVINYLYLFLQSGGSSWRDAPRESLPARSDGPSRAREDRGDKDRFRRDGPPRPTTNLEWRDSPRDAPKREER